MITPSLLKEQRLFTFTSGAEDEIERWFEPLRAERDTGPTEELVCLNAAEYSLIPHFPAEKSILPLESPIEVTSYAAHLALLKTNCTVMELCPEVVGARLVDVTAFSSDVAKLVAVGIPPEGPPEEIGDLARAVDQLEQAHLNSRALPARQFGSSGVLRLQGFLWAVKLSLRGRELHAAIEDAYAAFELAEPVGGVKVAQ